MSKLWKLRDLQNKTYGPFTTEKIIELIQKNVIEGEEHLASEDSNEFQKISKYPEFYDVLIANLEKEVRSLRPEEKIRELTQTSITQKKTTILPNSETQVPTKLLSDVHQPIKRGRVVSENKTPRKIFRTETINLTNLSEIKRNIQKNSFFTIGIIAFVFAALTYLFWEEGFEGTKKDRAHLNYPQKNRSEISVDEQKQQMKIILNHFQKDTFSDYYKAQNLLISLLESSRNNAEGFAMLCMVHRELWPYSYQDSQDQHVVTKTVQLAAAADAVGANGSICRIVQALIRNQTENAEAIVQNVLAEQPSIAILYEIKGAILGEQKNYESAIAYLQKTQTLWNVWLKPYYLEALYRKRLGDAPGASKILKNILSVNADHNQSKVLLGIIELFDFQHTEQAINLLLEGLEEGQTTREIRIEGFSALAAYYHRNDKKSKALEYAKKVFQIDPSNVDMRDLIVQLGGQTELEGLQSPEEELMALGDQYFKKGNYLAAQAQYKSAFEANNKNAPAALKAAQSLWRMNQSLDAIDWARKALRADGKFVEAYYEIADFYSQRYDFRLATEYLIQANKATPGHYLVDRGLALVELRRNSPATAITYALRALKRYESDVTTNVLLAKAYLGSGDLEKAYQYISRALELEGNNPEVQDTYTHVLAAAQGFRTAEDYIKKQISLYPNSAEYRRTLGQLYFSESNFSAAAQILEGALTITPEHVGTLILMGKSYKEMNEVNKALKFYLQAAGQEPSNVEPVFLIAELYGQSNESLKTALTYYEKVLRINPNFPGVYYRMGLLAIRMGDSRKAIDYGNEEKRRNPKRPEAYILLGEAYISLGQYTQAAGEIRQALQIETSDVNLYLLAARAYRLSGQLDVAGSMIKIANTKESGNPEVYKEQGAIFEKKGQSQEAVVSYGKYLELKPNAVDKSIIETKIQSLNSGGG